MTVAALPSSAFGATGLTVSKLSFGCGSVGGIMVRGSAAARERAVARALELGITYFDTAAAYGDGASERHLGEVWRTLRPEALIGTKFALPNEDSQAAAARIEASLHASLERLGMPSVDLFQLHNPITRAGGRGTLSQAFVTEQVVPALDRLKDAGKIRFAGFTAIGETDALLDVIDRGGFDGAQVVYNLLNPSAARSPAPGFTGQDYAKLLVHAERRNLATMGIRILAGGALSGTAKRHAVASPAPDPIGSGAAFADDVADAQKPALYRRSRPCEQPCRGRLALCRP